MTQGHKVLEQYFPEMRWRCLSLAADFDRIDRAGGADNDRITKLRDALRVLLTDAPNRAEQVQMIFSDTTPPPAR